MKKSPFAQLATLGRRLRIVPLLRVQGSLCWFNNKRGAPMARPLQLVNQADQGLLQAQTLGQRYDEILHICHDAARRKAAAVSQFVDDELRDVHTVKIHLANCAVL